MQIVFIVVERIELTTPERRGSIYERWMQHFVGAWADDQSIPIRYSRFPYEIIEAKVAP